MVVLGRVGVSDGSSERLVLCRVEGSVGELAVYASCAYDGPP